MKTISDHDVNETVLFILRRLSRNRPLKSPIVKELSAMWNFSTCVDWVRSALSLSGPTTAITGSLIDFAVVTGAIYLARRFVDKRSFSSLGLNINKQAGFDIIVGIAIAFVLMWLIYLIEYSFGWLKFESFAWQTESPSTVFSYTL